MIEHLRFYVAHSLNDLRINRQRTLFALLCIAAGVAAIVSLQTLAVMMERTLDRSLQQSNGGDIRLSPSGYWDQNVTQLDEGGFMGSYVYNATGLARLQDWLDEHYPGSELTYQQAVYGLPRMLSVSIPVRDTYQPLVYNYIVDTDEYPLYGSIESGDGAALDELLNAPTDIVISANLADILDAQVGDALRLSGVPVDFTITGIVPTDSETGFLNLPGHMFGYYYLDVRSVDIIDTLEPNLASMVFIRLSDPDQVYRAAARLSLFVRNADITTTSDLEEANNQLSVIVDNLVIVMGLVSLLLGGIGIVNTMAVTVSRRTNEVAVLKTLGLEPRQVVLLFLVEAVLMGIAGSVLGILGGWVLAYAVKGAAETFLGQGLAFTIAPIPALNGFVVGVIITTIFGFLPTLAAGQIRPAHVLRPNETIIPSTGRLSAFIAILCMVLAISVVAQGLLGDLVSDVSLAGSLTLRHITAGLGAIYGLVIAVPSIIGGILSLRRRRRGRRWLVYSALWVLLLAGLPVLGGAFGYAVPALLVLTVTILIVGYLYVTLWLVIWAIGGGALHDIWPGVLVLLFPLFWPLVPVLIVLLIPTWLLGKTIQRFGLVDFKIAMRAMLSTKSRGAATLLALVIGVFTLSLITMLVDTTTNAMEKLLEDTAGGNLMIIMPGGERTFAGVRDVLDANGDDVRSYSMLANFNTRLMSYWDASAERELSAGERSQLDWIFYNIEGREISSNLPDLDFVAGRNLDPASDTQPNADGNWPAVIMLNPEDEALNRVGLGDTYSIRIYDSDGLPHLRSFVVTGLANEQISFSEANMYVPLEAFDGLALGEMFVIADVKEDRIRDIRRDLIGVPGVFVLETRFLNDLVNLLVDQFTSFPLLVAALALFTGGVVIANTVALSTLERRREIGIMKAVGLQRERVLGMLLFENGLLGIVGGLIGVGISFVGLVIVLVQLFEDELGRVIPYSTAFMLMGLCVLIALGAALLSVWGASGEKPLNVLRYE